MLLTVETIIAVFVIFAGFAYLAATHKPARVAEPKQDPHSELLAKYHCEMTEEEARELHQTNWR